MEEERKTFTAEHRFREGIRASVQWSDATFPRGQFSKLRLSELQQLGGQSSLTFTIQKLCLGAQHPSHAQSVKVSQTADGGLAAEENQMQFLFQHVYNGLQHGLHERLQHHAQRHLHLADPEQLQHGVREPQHPQHHGLPNVQRLHVRLQRLHECRLPRDELLHSVAEVESQAAPGWVLLLLPPASPPVPPVLVSVHHHT